MNARPAPVPGGVSYVVPVLDEERAIVGTLRSLRSLRSPGDEILVVDGGSRDATPRLAAPWADGILRAPRGRAVQMNVGGFAARGRYLVFVHADTRLGEDFPWALAEADREGFLWGCARVALDEPGLLYRAIARGIDLRTRATGIVTGDQVLLVRRDVFRRLGGFPTIPLMEDVRFSQAARRLARPRRLRARAVTSARRWRLRGPVRTIVLMWGLRLAHALGASPERLARRYPPVRA